jgi:chemotaxis protein methyltransferase CheR
MTALPELAGLLRDETGISIDDSQLPTLALAIGRVAPELGADDFLARLRDPAEQGQLLALLIDEITVQETYFFREPAEFAGIDWHELLRLAREGGGDEVRIWVPACATGEEAYTLAMLATEALGHGDASISIIGTDISAGAIAAAAQGVYSARSMKNVPPDLVERHFVRDGRFHRIRGPLRSLVRFRRHNLIADASPPTGETPFELIACRNVLIYLDQATIEPTASSLESALRPGGRLILGAADRLTRTAARLAREMDDPVGIPSKSGEPPLTRALRQPLGSEPVDVSELADALSAADGGDLNRAIELTSRILDREPLDADALFVRGLAELGRDEPDAAIASLRRALYVDSSFSLAAFQLGRAYDAAGNGAAALKAYERALWTIDAEDERHGFILDQVDMGDVASACRVRLASADRPAVAR